MYRYIAGGRASSLFSTTAMASLLMAPGAFAQQAEPAAKGSAQIEEITVTATKTTSTVQHTPISITAVGGEDLQDRGITDFSSLAAATPSVSMKNNGPGQTEFEMRGMTSAGGNSPTVGFYLDDVPMTSPAAAQNGKVVIDPSLYDLNRVEVLRGPQGTLYGSGSMGGTIKLITNQPDPSDFHMSAETTLSGTDGGGFNHNDNLMVNIPLIKDQLALRIVGSESYTSGWIDRVVLDNFSQPTNGGTTRANVLGQPATADYKNVNDEQLYGVRATLLWQPLSNLTITPSIFYQTIHQGGPSDYDSVPGTQAHYQPFDISEPSNDQVTVYNLTINYTLDDIDFTSVTSKWRRVSNLIQDGSENFANPVGGFGSPSGTFYGPNGTGPVFGLEIDPSSQFSEEFRAASNGDGPLKWVAGLYYAGFKSDWGLVTDITNPAVYGSPTTNLFTLTQPTDIHQSAVFGEATYAITDQIKVTGGVRYFGYENTLAMTASGFGEPTGTNAPIFQHVNEDHYGFTPKINISYEPDENLMLYATAAKGFRPGGGNQPLPLTTPIGQSCFLPQLEALGYVNGNAPNSYGPDSVWSYEVGEKAKLLGNRLTVDAGLYVEEWKKIQLELTPCGYPLFDNSGNAQIFGGELEIKAILAEGLSVAMSGGAATATISQGDHGWYQGEQLPDVPNFTGSVNVTYDTPITDKFDLLARLENVYTGTRFDNGTYNGVVNYPQTPLPAYDLTNIRVGVVSSDGWTAALFANNLFNKRAAIENVAELVLPNGGYNRVATNQPLTVGLDISYKY